MLSKHDPQISRWRKQSLQWHGQAAWGQRGDRKQGKMGQVRPTAAPPPRSTWPAPRPRDSSAVPKLSSVDLSLHGPWRRRCWEAGRPQVRAGGGTLTVSAHRNGLALVPTLGSSPGSLYLQPSVLYREGGFEHEAVMGMKQTPITVPDREWMLVVIHHFARPKDRVSPLWFSSWSRCCLHRFS